MDRRQERFAVSLAPGLAAEAPEPSSTSDCAIIEGDGMGHRRIAMPPKPPARKPPEPLPDRLPILRIKLPPKDRPKPPPLRPPPPPVVEPPPPAARVGGS